MDYFPYNFVYHLPVYLFNSQLQLYLLKQRSHPSDKQTMGGIFYGVSRVKDMLAEMFGEALCPSKDKSSKG